MRFRASLAVVSAFVRVHISRVRPDAALSLSTCLHDVEEEENVKHHSHKTWSLLALLLGAPPLYAQDAPDAAAPVVAPPPAPVVSAEIIPEPEVTVEELVRRAIENNLQLPVAQANVEAARQRVAAFRSFPNPTLELVPRIVGSREAADSEVLLSQPLDVFGLRRTRASVAAAELRRAEAETTLAERGLVVAVKNAATELFAAQAAEALGSVQVEVAERFHTAAARRAELGDVPPVQVQRAELEVLRTQNEYSNARAERLSRRAALNQLIGQAPETPLRVALPLGNGLIELLRSAPPRPAATDNANPSTEPALTAPLPVEPTAPAPAASARASGNLIAQRTQILPEALMSRPDVVGAQATLEARRAQAAAIGRQRLPEVEIQARRSAFFGESGSYALRAVVTVPVFDFGSIKREKRAAEAEARAQEATVNLLRSQIATQVEQALMRLEQQQQVVERYRTGIVPLTLDLLRKTEIGYAAGASTILEVLEAQRTLRQVQTEYLQALVGTRTAETALESALGAVPPASLVSGVVNPTGAATPPGVAAPGTVPPIVETPQP